ncbi:MAG: diphthamide biosynthesis enzyme Dph2 [Candidatus Micrarchaeota archaeon]|nr:diphthamide biosynthesis enzyme Dph2 [Candidatus Micrarchaeota archaeon]
MRILLQFPEGLKQEALRHAKKLEAEGNEVIISASPTFGACDLAIDEAKKVGAEKLVHFGHAEFHHVDFNVEYVPYLIDASLDMLPESLKALDAFRRICLMTTIQHVHQLDSIKKFYEESGKEIVLNRPNGFAKANGQILGCDDGNVMLLDRNVDAFVYFGGGIFHPLGALLQTTKPFFIVDPFRNAVENIDSMRDRYRKRSRGKVLASLKARNFGILVSTKNGQYNMNLAGILKKRIEGAGLTAAILVSNTLDFDSINNMLEFDAFVNTACPRIAIDDTERLRKPLLSANELMEVLKLVEESESKESGNRALGIRKP